MSGALYLRRARLEIGTVAIPFEPDTGLRFSFDIKKNPYAREPNQAQLHISNLNARSRRAIESAFDPKVVGRQLPGLTKVTVQAGYKGISGQPGTMGTIFEGHSTNVVSTRATADWETRVLASSGLLTNDVRTSKTYPAKLNFNAVVQDLLGILKSNISDIDFSQVTARIAKGDFQEALNTLFQKPFTFEGPVMAKLDSIMRPQGFELSEQDGKLQLVQVNETLSNGGLAFRLNSRTGLIGTLQPVKDDKLPGAHCIRGRSLLRHEMQIGSAIFIDSEVEKGFYKVRTLHFHGDTHSANWYVDFTAVEASGGVAT